MCAQNAGLEDDFGIGSVSKALTGMLYVDALGRGEVGPRTRLGNASNSTARRWAGSGPRVR